MKLATKHQPSRSTLGTDPQLASRAAEMIKALGHPVRLRIVALLCDGPRHVTALAQQLGAKQSIVSQQLRILRSHRLVQVMRANGHAYYRIARPELQEMIRCVTGCTLA